MNAPVVSFEIIPRGGPTAVRPAVVAFMLAAVLAALAWPSTAGAADEFQEHWQGVWHTDGIHGDLKLFQDGRTVTGRYIDPDGKKVKGAKLFNMKAKGPGGARLVGEYDCDGAGTFDITLVSIVRFEGEYDPEGFLNRPYDWSGNKD